MSYKASAFNRCVFNPIVPSNMLESYPRLSEIVKPDWRDAELDRLLRYLIMVYDPGSPLVKDERDLNYRKNIASDLAGFTVDDADFLATVFDFTHEYFSQLVTLYLQRFARSKEFAAIVIVENCFWESAKKLLEPISGKDSKAELEAVQKKSAIKDELDKDIARLDRYYKTFFGEDEQLEKKARGRMTPETVALQE